MDYDIIKKLGHGRDGDAYLIIKNNKKYVRKVQKISNESSIEAWRELDLYNYINHMVNDDQIFFTKLYEFDIYKNKNSWYLETIIQYENDITLRHHLFKNNVSVKQFISFLLQICNIMLILYKGGYSHGDLHTKNIIVVPTKLNSFTIKNKNIPFYSYRLISIDYGKVKHKKYDIVYNDLFDKDRKKYLFDECSSRIINLIINYDKFRIKCKECLPFTKDYEFTTIQKLMRNHKLLFIKIREKYLNLFPESKKIFKDIDKNINNNSLKQILNKHKDIKDYNKVIRRIEAELFFIKPKIYMKVFLWNKMHKSLLSYNEALPILMATNYEEIVKELYLLLKNV